MNTLFYPVKDLECVSACIKSLFCGGCREISEENGVIVEIPSPVNLSVYLSADPIDQRRLFPIPVYSSLQYIQSVVEGDANLRLRVLDQEKACLAAVSCALCFLIVDKSTLQSPSSISKAFSQCQSLISEGSIFEAQTSHPSVGNADELWQQYPEYSVDTTEPLWSPPRGQILPNILPSMLVNDEYKVIYPNSAPIPFENNFFTGVAVLMVNSSLHPLSEPFKSKFKNDKNTFEVQIQGKFIGNIPPKAAFYVGAEITKRMELGLFTRGLCGSILNFCRSFSASLRHSFGDKQDRELPHIVAPLWNTVDRLVVTPPGQSPPPLIERFPEEEPQRKKRKKDPSYAISINLDYTYSFSLKTSYMDMEKWCVVNIPVMSNMSLQTFWDNADVRFLLYFLDLDQTKELDKQGSPKYHEQGKIERLFSLQVEYRGNHEEWGREGVEKRYREIGGEEEGDRDEEIERREGAEITGREYRRKASDVSDARTSLSDEGEEEEGGEEEEEGEETDEGEFFDAVEGYDTDPLLVDIRREIKRAVSPPHSAPSTLSPFSPAPTVTPFSPPPTRPDGSLFTSIDLSPPPFYSLPLAFEIDLYPPSAYRGGIGAGHKKLVYYAYARGKRMVSLKMYREVEREKFLVGKRGGVGGVVGGEGEIGVGERGGIGEGQWGRLSQIEQRRVLLEASYRHVESPGGRESGTGVGVGVGVGAEGRGKLKDRFRSFLGSPSTSEMAGFLFYSPPSLKKSKSKKRVERESEDRGEGDSPSLFPLLCYVQESASLFCQTLLSISSSTSSSPPALSFSKPTRPSSPRFKLSFSSLLGVRRIEEEYLFSLGEGGIEGVLLSTVSRQYTLLFPAEQGERVVQYLLSLLSSPPYSFSPMLVDANAPHLLSSPRSYQLGEKSVLNARQFTSFGAYRYQLSNSTSLSPALSSSSSSSPLLSLLSQPAALAMRMLEIAFILAQHAQSQESSSTSLSFLMVEDSLLWIEFLDGLSLLQCLDYAALLSPTSPEALSFFLNLYHTLLLHGLLVLGRPATIFSWQSFFRKVCYDLGGEVVSLAELEHCVLRYGMNRPNINFLAQSLIPSSTFSFSLLVKDYRLLFAINCCSTSTLSSIPIYHPQQLDRQLDAVMRQSLAEQVSVVNSTLHLPSVCQWYCKDFEPPADSPPTSSTTRTVLATLMPYFTDNVREQVKQLLEKPNGPSVKYSSLEFICRFPTKMMA